MGTFSTVYLAELKKEPSSSASSVAASVASSPRATATGARCRARFQDQDALPERVALKHLIPTSSTDRILMEVECLRRAGGKDNVISLLFCRRDLGDVVLGMPFVQTTKFADALPSLSRQQCLVYARNLFRALSHVHSIGVIHRDVKPANFLFDFKRNVFRLVDFGLAQASPGRDIK